MAAIMGRNRADHNEPRDVHRDVARGHIPRTRAERLAERDRLITAHRYGKGGLRPYGIGVSNFKRNTYHRGNRFKTYDNVFRYYYGFIRRYTR